MPNIYSDITAQLYDEWFGKEPYEDQAFYQYFIERDPGPALEIGSGTGRLLLAYLRDGLDVEGLEPSEDMISICQEKAQKMGLKPILHKQAMESLSTTKKYQTIYIPFCSFQLVDSHDAAQATLKKFYDHLQDKGQLLISLFIPQKEPKEQNIWRIRRTLEKQNGQIILLSESIINDWFEQLQTEYIKYEIYEKNILKETKLTKLLLRWYQQFEFKMMLEMVGFKNIEILGDYSLQEAHENNQVYIWRAVKIR